MLGCEAVLSPSILLHRLENLTALGAVESLGLMIIVFWNQCVLDIRIRKKASTT